MKKITAIVLSAAFILSLTACGNESGSPSTTTSVEETTIPAEAYYSSPEDVSIDKLIERTLPETILKSYSGFKCDYTVSNSNDDILNNGTNSYSFIKKDGVIYKNEASDYADGYYTHLFYSNDDKDLNIYIASNAGYDIYPMASNEVNESLSSSVFGYNYFEDVRLLSVTEENGMYHATVEVYSDGSLYEHEELTIDPQTGFVVSAKTTYGEGYEASGMDQTFTYSNNLEIDETPKTDNPAYSENSTDNSSVSNSSGEFNFETTDINGNPVSGEDIKNAKVVMVNYWEPWCGPCVGELPELQKLYENYKDKGFLLLGVYSSFDMDDDAKEIIADSGVTYPILRAESNLSQFMTDYFPTTIFVDGNGNVLSEEPYIGARSYEDWEEILKGYLK